MADLKYYDVIQKPIVTEKSMASMEEKKYTFAVHPDATKSQVKEAVEKLFDGTKVSTVTVRLVAVEELRVRQLSIRKRLYSLQRTARISRSLRDCKI